MAKPQTYSIPAIARELQCDARRVRRALSGVPADATTHAGGRRWHMQTAKSALRRHGHNLTGSGVPRNGDSSSRGSGGRGNGGGSDLDRALDALEHIAADLQAALDGLKAERSIAKRRAKAKTIGPLLIKYREALDRSAEMLPPNLAALTRAARGEMLGEALAEIAAVLALDFDRCA
jgi:hypothetical protein